MPPARILLVILGGGVLLLWGGARLQRTFIEERSIARRSISAREQALQQYARVVLERRLREAMAVANSQIDAALANPLQTRAGLLAVEDGEQRLPRVVRYLVGRGTPGVQLYHRAQLREVEATGPFGERVAILGELRRALDDADRESIAENVRAWLNHESRYVVPVTQALPLRAAMLGLFMSRATPDRALLSALLRDGLRGSRGRHLAGLQPLLLDNRERFTRADFEQLAREIAELSRRGRVIHDDFRAVVTDADGTVVPVPERLEEPALLDAGRWYAVPFEVTHLRGVAIDLPKLFGDITTEMRSGGLLASEDALQASCEGDLVLVEALPVAIRSKSFAREAAEVDERYLIKTVTGVALGVMVAGVALLVGLLYRRERKFLEGKASFIATVSHELRTPIASLRLMGETLERRLAGVESARDFPSRIVGEAERLNFLVENILSYNRLEKASVSTNRQLVTVSELVDAVRADAGVFTRKPVDILIQNGGEATLSVDPELLHLLLSNLVQNSCKYNDREQVEIRVEALVDSDRAVLRIADNGVGIVKQEWDRVFTEFVRSRNAGAGGFGLGLALCRRIVGLHEGTIRVADSSNEGTTFELEFPTKDPGAKA